MTEPIRDTLFGIILDAPNHNGRIYPAETIMHAFEAAMGRDFPLLVTVDEPSTANIPLDRVCGEVIGIERDGTSVAITWKLTQTPMGRVVETLLAAKVKMDMISIGAGNVSDEGVISDYEPTGFYLAAPRHGR